MDLATATDRVRILVGEDCGLDSKLLFDFGDDGRIFIDATTVPNVVANDGADPDCTITMAIDDFAEMLSGDLDGTTAYMTGRLKVAGDMGVAMKLAGLFNR